MINIKIDQDLKEQAAKLAESMGFNLSSVITATLRNFVSTRELHVSAATYEPTPYLAAILDEVATQTVKDWSPAFKSADEAFDWLNKQEE